MFRRLPISPFSGRNAVVVPPRLIASSENGRGIALTALRGVLSHLALPRRSWNPAVQGMRNHITCRGSLCLETQQIMVYRQLISEVIGEVSASPPLQKPAARRSKNAINLTCLQRAHGSEPNPARICSRQISIGATRP